MLVKKIFKLKNLKYMLLVFLSACIENAPLDSLSPEGPYARSIDELFWITFWIAVVIFVIVQGALLLSVFVYKEKPDSPEPKTNSWKYKTRDIMDSYTCINFGCDRCTNSKNNI